MCIKATKILIKVISGFQFQYDNVVIGETSLYIYLFNA